MMAVLKCRCCRLTVMATKYTEDSYSWTMMCTWLKHNTSTDGRAFFAVMTAVSAAAIITAAYSPTTLTATVFLAASTALQQLMPKSDVVTFSKGYRGKRKSASSSCKEELPIFLRGGSLHLLLPCHFL
eukprot:15366603-Ditylum_brightwellii.AAC.1